MNRMKHLVTAITAVIVVVTGLSTGAALLRHRAAAGQGGEAGGHDHGAHTDGVEMGEKGMKMDENKSAGHPAGHGGEDKDQPAGQAGANGGDGGAANPQGMQGHAMSSTAPSAAEMLEPLLSASRPATTRAAPKQLYTCSMHPEVVSESSGKCPKCGMNLVPQK